MPNGRDPVEAWQFTIGIDLHSAERVARERAPDVELAILTVGAGWIRAEVVAGTPKNGSLLLVSGRAMFEVTRRDEWRVADRSSDRVFVMLRTVSGEQSTAAAALTRRSLLV